MCHSKCGANSLVVILGILLVLSVPLGFAETISNESIEYKKVQRFVLSSRVAQEDRTIRGPAGVVHMGANLVGQYKGQLNWLAQDPNGFVLDMKVLQVDLQFPDPQPKEPAQITDVKPFVARVTMSKEDEVPLSIQITEGKIQDNPLALARQYKVAYLILDMMCATVVEKEFIVSKDGWGASLSITLPNKVNIGQYEALPISRIKSSFSPTKFTVLPRMSYKGVEETQLFTFTHGSLNIYLFSRLLDNKTGLATHAVNLEATSKVEMKDKDYVEMIRLLNMPHEFERYLLFELKVTAAAETRQREAPLVVETAPSTAQQTKNAPRPERQPFVFSGIAYHKNMNLTGESEEAGLESFAKETVLGQLRWLQKTADKVELEIEFIRFEYAAEPKALLGLLQKKQPFKAMITMDRNQQPNLRISIPPQGLPKSMTSRSSTYGIVVTILEMMLPPTVERKLAVSPDGKHLSMEVFFPEKALIEYEEKPVSVNMTSIRQTPVPTTFSCSPVFEDGRRSGWELSDLSVSSRTVRYFRRYLDEASGLATRAVNLKFAVSKKAEKATQIGKTKETRAAEKANMVDLIDGFVQGQPNPYKYYYLYELELKKQDAGK